ncbi:EamA family transporter RarD [Nakamurella sp. YIM 132084]|uniref:EamA family transporter RarD n=2 Tax=Nakamurella leprariae TaxID=2803911 RepID=A0A938Y549_9ACTN|nr:EamA family transporter RarD [Nakamurella leprariae]
MVRSDTGGAPVDRRGLLLGLTAYLMWGLFPLWFPLLAPAGAGEILAHRMIWSFVCMAVVTSLMTGWRPLWRLGPRQWLMLAAAAVLIAVNWGVYIWAVNAGHVVDAALGYFINPLITVALGVLVFRERLRRAQWVSVGLGTAAVVVLVVGSGSAPWTALVLATSFGLYGAIKKVVRAAPTVSMTAEGLIQLVPAAVFLVVLQVHGGGTLDRGAGHLALLAVTGLLTCLPLLAFAGAAQRLPFTVLGGLQYLGPVLQLLLGVLWFDETMPPYRWAGFVIIWLALVVLSLDAVRTARRGRAPA